SCPTRPAVQRMQRRLHSRRYLPSRAGRYWRLSPSSAEIHQPGQSSVSDSTSPANDALRAGNRVVVYGVAAIVAILILAAGLLFMSLPDANAFNLRVERIFVENDALTTDSQIKLLEILAQSGTAFSEVLTSYRLVIFVLL